MAVVFYRGPDPFSAKFYAQGVITGLQGFIRQAIFSSVPTLFVQITIYSFVWHLIASQGLRATTSYSDKMLKR
jgi:hypothetical protein